MADLIASGLEQEALALALYASPIGADDGEIRSGKTNQTGASWHEANVLGLTAAGTPATNYSAGSRSRSGQQ